MRRASNWGYLLLVFAAVALIATPALAQNPTGTLTGSVTGPDGAALPGVTVTATSPNLQGARVVNTGPNGTYKLGFLPPGDYEVTYELDGFSTSTRAVKLSAAVNTQSDIVMQLGAVEEEIVVTGQQAAISESNTGSSTFSYDEVEDLPIARDLDAVVTLTPGTTVSGVTGGVSIAGAMTFENLWTLNGVVINENVRGQELPLFIEDAIQETTTQVSGISAEYGRFQGGVINAITKSGGNEFTGSFRVSLTNDDWVETPDHPALNLTEPIDDISQSYEATLGGYLWKDHIWFFGAGRDESETAQDNLPVSSIPFTRSDEELRYEAKLTGTIADSHTIIGTYLEIDRTRENDFFFTSIDRNSLTDREDPQELKSINYTGILTPSFFVEAQYSERDFQIAVGSGANSRTLVGGTLMRSRSGGERYYTPTFCGVCEQEIRNNENALAKASWFLSTEGMGTHDLVFGYDTFTDIRFAVNHQTGSDFTVWDTNFNIIGDEVFPTIYPCQAGGGCETTTGQNPGFRSGWIGWWAVFNLGDARPTDFNTNSFYVNDRWQFNENWSFNLGVRYDESDGQNSAGVTVLDDNEVSPRFGVNWDVKGDGDLVAHANYGTYVAAVTNTIADSTSSGGAIGLFLSQYGGPALNVDCSPANPGACQPTEQVLTEVFDWFLNNGGTNDLNDDLSNLPNVISVSIPGATSGIQGTLASPSTDEIAVGVTKRLGNRGLLRADIVSRDYENFYSNQTNTGTGQVGTAQGPADFTAVGNFGDQILEREYLGLHLQTRYRFTDRISAAVNYALSELEGNVVGESGPSGPLTTSPNNYPEYFDPAWSYPEGKLPDDQTHKFRGWVIVDLLDTQNQTLSLSVLQNFESGQTFSLADPIDTRPFVANPGYETPPSTVTYFFSDRGEFNYDDISSTDLSLNYAFLWNTFGRQVEVYLQPEVLNLFNEDSLEAFDTRIDTAGDAPGLVPFNPFTTTPVEGVHWKKRDGFGDPLAESQIQDPREYRVSLGFRF